MRLWRPLDEHAREHLLRWRAAEGLAIFEEAINQLRNAAAQFETRRKRFVQDCQHNRAAWAAAKEEIRKATEEISRLDSDLQGKDFGLEELRALQSKLREVTDNMVQRGSEVTRARDAAAVTEQRLLGLRESMKRRAKDDAQTSIIQRRFEATQSVAKALRTMRQSWMTIVQEYVNEQLKANWGKVAQLDRFVEFGSNFQLSIKERGPGGSWITSAPSSANLRALALCFVSALIKLANDIGKEDRQKPDAPRRNQMFQGGDYPLVMDAPFATMDYFKKTLPKGLRSVVPQMVLISTNDQWSGEVEASLLSAVGAAYVLELHLPGGEDKSSSISFNSTRVDYVVPEPGATKDWSVIREVPQ